MLVTIIHIGGTEKIVEFEGFDAPRPWARLRFPAGAGLFNFALAHGGIECKRTGTPDWRISEADLEAIRAEARGQKIKFAVKPWVPYRRTLPGAPKKKTDQRTLSLFPERET